MHLSILTLNLNYYVDKHGPWNDRKQLIKEVIEQANPDLVALQAVAQDPQQAGGQSQVAQLAAMLPAYAYQHFQAALVHENGQQDGNALLSKLPLAHTDFLKLSLRPGLEDTSHRIVLYTRLTLPTGDLNLYNAHFSWVAEQAQDNVLEALNYTRTHTGPSVLVGDLNTPPDSEVFTPLRQEGWVDAWGKLYPQEDGHTFESNRLFTRIDYAWVSAGLERSIQDVRILRHERDNTVRLSDHLGLLVKLEITGG